MRPRPTLLIALVIIGLGVPGPGAQALSLKGFKSGVVSFLLKRISVPGQFEISADKVERAEAGATVLSGVHISDDQGEWFRAERFVLRWSPSRLLKGEVQIDQLQLAGGVLERLPSVPAPAPEQGKGGVGPAQWPRSPIAVSVRELLVTDFRVSAAVLPGGLGVSGRGAFRDEGHQQRLELSVKRVDTVRGAIELNASRNFDTDTLTLSVAADEAPGGLVANLGALPPNTPVRLHLQGDGTAAGWKGGLELGMGELLNASGTLEATWATRIGATLNGRFRPGPAMQASLREAIGAEAMLLAKVAEDGGGRIQIERAEIRSASASANLAGSVARATGELNLKLAARVSPAGARRLSALSEPLVFGAFQFDASIEGPTDALSVIGKGTLTRPAVAGISAAAVNLETRVTAENSGYRLEVDLEALDPEGPDARYAEVLGNRLSMLLRGSWSSDQLELSRAEMRTPLFTSSLVGTVGLADPLTPRLRYAAEISELRPLAGLVGLNAGGRLHARGTIEGVVGAADQGVAGGLEISGQLKASGAQVNDESLGAVAIIHEVSLGDTLRAGFDLRMKSPTFGAGKAVGRFEQDPRKWRLDDLDVDLLGVLASGTARGGLVNPPAGAAVPGQRARTEMQGEFKLDIASLVDIGRVLGVPLEGQGRGTLGLATAGGGTAIIALELEHLEVDEFTLSGASIRGSVAGLTAELEPQLTVQLQGGSAPNAELDTLTLVLDGPLGGLVLTTDASGQFDSKPVTLSASARADLDGPSKTMTFDTLRTTIGDDTVALDAPATVVAAGNAVKLDDLDLQLPDGGRLTGAAQWSDEILRSSMVLNAAPLRFITALLDVPVVTGTLAASIDVNTGRANPALDASFQIDGVRMAGLGGAGVSHDVPPVSLDASATWDGALLSVTTELTGDFGPPVKANARMAMRPTYTWRPEIGLQEEIAADVQWRGELARLFGLLPLPDHLLSGDAVLDIRVQGTANTPVVTGAFSISGGRYENLVLGTIIDDLVLRSKFTEQGALALELDGTDGARGTFSIRGDVKALGGDAPGLEVRSRWQDFLLVRIDTATAQASGELNVAGATDDMDVRGAVVVQRAEVRLLNPLSASVVDLGEVRLRGEPPPEAPSAPAAGENVRLDVTVNFPSQVFVRGRGLDSEWGGGLSVKGTAAQPAVTGRIRARRGQLNLIGRIFKLDKGDIAFTGGQPIDPTVGITLAREANGITGKISVEGPASAPGLVFSAVPPVPEDEVLPRVLFGRSTANLSATEALELAAGVAALTGGGEGVADRLRNSLGVDVLRIESAQREGEASSAAVGRYLREGVYVGAKQSLDGKRSSVVLEIELLDEIVFDLDLGYTTRSSAGVTWKRDF